VAVEKVADEIGFLNGRGAENGVIYSLGEGLLDGLGRPEAAAELDLARNGPADRPYGREVLRRTAERSVEVNDVDPLHTRGFETAGHLCGIVAEIGPLVGAPLPEADTMARHKIYGRYDEKGHFCAPLNCVRQRLARLDRG